MKRFLNFKLLPKARGQKETRTPDYKDPRKCPKDPFPDPDRIWQNFYFSHSTVRIDFSKIWQKASSVFPDRNPEIFLTFGRFRIEIGHRTC